MVGNTFGKRNTQSDGESWILDLSTGGFHRESVVSYLDDFSHSKNRGALFLTQ